MKSTLKPLKSALAALIVSAISTQAMAAEKSLGLMDVYQLALKNDATLAQAKLQLQADDSSLNALEGGLYPQVNASLSHSLTRSESSTDFNTTSAGVSVQQSIYQHDLWSRIDQSKQALTLSQLQVALADQSLILRTTEAYFKVLLAQENLKLLQAKQTADQKQLETVLASQEVGMASSVDVSQAQSTYDLSRADVISAQNALDNAREELNRIVAQPLGALNNLPTTVELTQTELDMDRLQKQAEQSNLEVLIANASWTLAQQEVEVQKAGHYPSVSAQLSMNDSNYTVVSGNGAFNDGLQSTLSLQVSVPVYSGGSVENSIDAARFSAKKSAEALRDSRANARLQARVQMRNLEQGDILIAALREAVKSSNTFLEAAEESYKVGLNDLLNVLSARASQVQAKRNLVEALHNQLLNRLRLESTLGDLTVQDLRQVDAYLSESIADSQAQ